MERAEREREGEREEMQKTNCFMAQWPQNEDDNVVHGGHQLLSRLVD